MPRPSSCGAASARARPDLPDRAPQPRHRRGQRARPTSTRPGGLPARHAADPADARLLFELDQLRKRLGHDPAASPARPSTRSATWSMHATTLPSSTSPCSTGWAGTTRPWRCCEATLPSLGGRRRAGLAPVGRRASRAGAGGAASTAMPTERWSWRGRAMTVPAEPGRGQAPAQPGERASAAAGPGAVGARAGWRSARPGSSAPRSRRATPTASAATHRTGRPWRCASWVMPMRPSHGSGRSWQPLGDRPAPRCASPTSPRRCPRCCSSTTT